jgi:protein-disulfide isomerase/uncharacterized membrane protein
MLRTASLALSGLCLLATAGMVAQDQPALLAVVALGAAALAQGARHTGDRPHSVWPLAVIAALVTAGIGISVYMTRHHEVELYGGAEYQAEELVGCVEAEGVSCDIVNTSEWSELAGVPLFTWAVPTYLLLLLLAGLAISGRHRTKSALIALGVGATLFSALLFYISKVELGAVCLWCMRLYAINGVLPALAFGAGLRDDDTPNAGVLNTSAAVFVVTALLSIGAQRSFRASLLSGTPEIAAIAADDNETVSTTADPTGPAPALAFDIVTEDGNPARIEVQPDDAWKGNPNAKVAIVEFADFECGYCKRAGFQLRRLYEHYKDEIVFVYKHFPMDPACNPGVNNMRHRDACKAHEASVCAQKQGYFWAYHDLLYKNNHQLRPEHLLAYAEKVGLDMNAFRTCMQNHEGLAKVQASGADGAKAETHGTPRIWIDGKLYRAGSSAEQMARAIEIALGHAATDAAANAAALADAAPTMAPIPADVPSMRHIQYGGLDFWIDTFEAGLTEGKATSGKHQIPGYRMSWYAAKDACEASGKRMCTEQEWIAACQSAAPIDDDGDGQFADDLIEGNAYPYGDFHTPQLCWEAKQADPRAPAGEAPQWRPVYTGEMPGCVSADGVYDLSGNMEEWVGATPESAVLLGGAFDTPDDKARCYRRNDTFGAGYSNLRTGARCCSNSER